MARKTGQIIRRGPGNWFLRICVGRDAETGRRKCIGKQIRGGLRDAQAHLSSLAREVHAFWQLTSLTRFQTPEKLNAIDPNQPSGGNSRHVQVAR